ncbi:MAG: hypothetical protein QM660_14090 [Dysgonomonas sp.]
MRSFIILTLISISFLLISCSRSKHGDELLLSMAQSIVETNPDSSLILLDSITDPTAMEHAKYMEYIVTKIQAKFKTYNDISEDTLIFKAKKYFEDHKQYEQAATAYFYAGCLQQENNIIDKATVDYMQAFDFAKKIDNKKLMGISQYYLGEICYKHDLPDSAITHYKIALLNYEKIDNTESIKINLYSQIAKASLLAGYPNNIYADSSILYYQKALNLAKNSGFSKSLSSLTQQLAVTFREIGDYNKAKQYFIDALSTAQEPFDSACIYLNLTKTYKICEEYDSAKYYSKKLEEFLPKISDNYILNDSYSALADLANDLQSYKAALEYKNKEYFYTQEITKQEKSIDILNIEKKYNLAKKEKALLEYQIREQYLIAAVIVIILLLLIASLSVKVIYERHKQEKQINTQLKKQVDNILYLNKVYKNIRVAFNAFEKEIDTLLISYGIKDKSEGYEIIRAQFKKIDKVAEENLGKLTLDFLSEKKIDKQILSTLKSNDLLFLSLILCGYESKEIAIILGINMHALQMRKSRLAKKISDLGFSPASINQYLE